MRELLNRTNRILIGGHRGCICRYPENSIAAMEHGLLMGADYLEIDIQLTKDGTAVVWHDTRLEKKTRLQGYVHEHILEELRGEGPGLCTFQEAMEWGRGRKAWFGLEIKTVPADMQEVNKRLMDTMVPLLRKCEMADRVFVFGADYQVLQYLKRLAPEVEIGLIVPFVPPDPVGLMKSMDALIYLSYIYNMTPEIIRNLQENDFYVSGAILREDQWVRRACEYGVNMFESDYPGEAKRFIDDATGF